MSPIGWIFYFSRKLTRKINMHSKSLEKWTHEHDFSQDSSHGEQKTIKVLILTAATMLVEIIAGSIFGSMALLADGWHMGTHVAAFLITIFAYRYAKKHAANPSFTFGTGKVSVLGGFASAVALAAVALIMAAESIQRLFSPHEISFDESIYVAVLGLFINLICAWLLQGHHHHHQDKHENHHGHHDHNLKAAYFHVLADALTSILAIIALLCGKYFGLNWLDPVMGIVGALVISRWAYGLLKETSPLLLDETAGGLLPKQIISLIESDSDNLVSDFHLLKINSDQYAAIVSLVTHYPKDPSYYKNLLTELNMVTHVTIEVNKPDSTPCKPQPQMPLE